MSPWPAQEKMSVERSEGPYYVVPPPAGYPMKNRGDHKSNQQPPPSITHTKGGFWRGW